MEKAITHKAVLLVTGFFTSATLGGLKCARVSQNGIFGADVHKLWSLYLKHLANGAVEEHNEHMYTM